MTTIITVNKGGTGEHTVDLRDHRVPDAWHAAMRADAADQALILDLWDLAHAMRDHITAEADAAALGTEVEADPFDCAECCERHNPASPCP